MRIWAPIPPVCLDRQRLLGEHRELHAIWTILTTGKSGYRNHPEVKRWHGWLKQLAIRHDMLIEEMTRRGYKHASPLVLGTKCCNASYQWSLCDDWPQTWQPIEHMRQLLAEKQTRSIHAALQKEDNRDGPRGV